MHCFRKFTINQDMQLEEIQDPTRHHFIQGEEVLRTARQKLPK